VSPPVLSLPCIASLVIVRLETYLLTLLSPDDRHQRTFWVDTNANPPRSIWTHPADDPDWQRSQGGQGSFAPPPGPPPSHNSYSNSNGYPQNEKSSFGQTNEAPSFQQHNSYGSSQPSYQQQQQSTSSSTSGGKKGIFGKIKEKLNAPPGGQRQQGYAGQPMYGQQQGYPQQGGMMGGGGGGMFGNRMGGGGMMGGGGGRGGGMNPVSSVFLFRADSFAKLFFLSSCDLLSLTTNPSFA
jgi:hypothetical protein